MARCDWSGAGADSEVQQNKEANHPKRRVLWKPVTKCNAQSLQSPQDQLGLLPPWLRPPHSQCDHQCPARTRGSLEERQRGLWGHLHCLRWGGSWLSGIKRAEVKKSCLWTYLKKSQRHIKLKGNVCRQVKEPWINVFSKQKKVSCTGSW